MGSGAVDEIDGVATSSESVWFCKDFVATQDGALPQSLCQRLISTFEASERQRPGVVGQGIDLEKKRSIDITLDQHPEWSDARGEILALFRRPVEEYLAHYHLALIGALSPAIRNPSTGKLETLNDDNWATAGKPLAAALVWRTYGFGVLNLQKYERNRGGFPHWHSEIYPQRGTASALHRLLFVMAYLNDVSEGGETDFYYQGLSVVPKAGRVLIAPAGFTHTHRGRVPISGDKYIATTWLMFKPADALYGQVSDHR
jgi:hypothetical protein